ncbi:TIGR02281 family clan AA aspartic protease [Burkholderiaceae bacterium UC74_6]
MLRALILGGFLLLAGAAASAQQVAFSGSMGSSAALLMIDGQPKTVRVGESVQGVKLVSLDGGQAVVEVSGARRSLTLGGTPASIGGSGGGSTGRQIVLSASSGGHFLALGSINNRAVNFMVDTGATVVSISQGTADQLGIKYREGRRVMAQTANGVVQAYVVNLTTVRIGDVEVRGVEALVVPAQMSHVLLGNSFLTRFQMRRDNDILTLTLMY